MHNLIHLIKERADAWYNTAWEVRSHMHANPELSFQEYNTSAYIKSWLEKQEISFQSIADTGITGVLSADTPGGVLGLRSELDALPIQETNTAAYCSTQPGIMHACGHDVHTACMLGALLILKDLKAHWKGHIKFMFQPGEEKLPGGASIMIREGVLENPAPKALLAQHVQTDIPVGKVGFRQGMYMASCDEIYITIQGKGGHAAMPGEGRNPLFAAAHVLLKLEELWRIYNTESETPIVINFGSMHADGATNVVPDTVRIAGTFRAFDEKMRSYLQNAIKETAEHAAKEKGCTAEVRIDIGYPYLHNHEAMTLRAKQAAIKLWGADNVLDLPLRMTSEDFAIFSHQSPVCFYRLGNGNKEKGIVSPVHTSTFDIDPETIRIGMITMAFLAINELNYAA